jgi:hypothetical protein
MLFDLRGRRRRAVQATYLTLAILMGGGLVFFGIGGDVQGGLFDAFSERGGGGSGNDAIEKRVDRTEERLVRDPDNPALLKELVRDYYSLATAQAPSGSTGFPDDAKDELREAGAAWQRYLKAEKGKPDGSLAAVALQVYDVSALNRPKEAQEAAAIVAEQENDVAAYIRLVQYATLAGDTRTANLAGQKAVDLAPKAQKKAVQAQIKQAKALQAQTGTPGR